MKLNQYLTIFILTVIYSCSNSSSNKLKNIVSAYVKSHAKNGGTYHSLYFSQVDTTNEEFYKDSLMRQYKPEYKYSIQNVYEIMNSENEKAAMTVSFHFDSTLNIISTSPEGLNGDYGELTGNVYWKYNNFVGNKPDAGSEAHLFSLDTLRKHLKYETTCDVMGNFKFDKVLSGFYLLIVKSKNTTNSPDNILDGLLLYSPYLAQLFDYDIAQKLFAQIKEYKTLDSLYEKLLLSEEVKFGHVSKQYEGYTKVKKQKMDLAENIISKLPKEFQWKIGLYGPYSNKIDFSTLRINEGKTNNKVIDFGITYF